MELEYSGRSKTGQEALERKCSGKSSSAWDLGVNEIIKEKERE